jgi:hypothetical protein
VWKYWVVSSLLATADRAVAESLREELDRIVTSPTLGEVREELPDAVLHLRQESTIQ